MTIRPNPSDPEPPPSRKALHLPSVPDQEAAIEEQEQEKGEREVEKEKGATPPLDTPTACTLNIYPSEFDVL